MTHKLDLYKNLGIHIVEVDFIDEGSLIVELPQ